MTWFHEYMNWLREEAAKYDPEAFSTYPFLTERRRKAISAALLWPE